MISSTVVKTLEEWIPTENIYREEPMSRHTTFRIGGNADCLLQIESAEQLSKVKKYLKALKKNIQEGGKRAETAPENDSKIQSYIQNTAKNLKLYMERVQTVLKLN